MGLPLTSCLHFEPLACNHRTARLQQKAQEEATQRWSTGRVGGSNRGIEEEEERKRVGTSKRKEGMRGKSTDTEKKNSSNVILSLTWLLRSV